jgi:RimJ/RimL family protein N-acetyltransferase
MVAPEFQGLGYASAAARALVEWARHAGLTAVANIASGHGASGRVAARAGLRPTAERAGGERVWRDPQSPAAASTSRTASTTTSGSSSAIR